MLGYAPRASDTLFNLLLGTPPMRAAASIVYFHRKGVFDPRDATTHESRITLHGEKSEWPN